MFITQKELDRRINEAVYKARDEWDRHQAERNWIDSLNVRVDRLECDIMEMKTGSREMAVAPAPKG